MTYLRKPDMNLLLVHLFLLMLRVFFFPGAAHGEEFIVSAAASLSNALQAVGTQFQKDHPDERIIFNFAASGALLRQIEQGAPVDLFASANQAFMDEAQAKGLIRSATRRDFARNTLVLAVPADSPGGIRQAADLADTVSLRIAIGNPDTVPAGRYARQALKRLGLWDSCQERLILANSVRQVLDYLRRGEVDAGLVYATDIAIAGDRVVQLQTLATDSPIRYCIAAVNKAAHPRAGSRFIAYLCSTKGQRILGGFGFQAP
ncbi:MAG: molybdate ABC transporter substrate-binding protein [Desulfatitalea sp.]|nr:molybdate ABC transporter substrate-binding protein [Desulfatitalea sp.]NNK02393.1 molybdate ABC transporter substrate-binding protein [Desulfatitalea sp.]